MKKYCYFNGKIIESKKASLPINDIGVIRGYSIFDYFRTYNGRLFRLSDYYKRFKKSAKSIGFDIPISQKELESILLKLLKKNKDTDSAFRLVLTGGASSNSISLESKGNFYVIAENLPKIDPKYYKEGAKLITSEYQRQIPESKTASYIHAVKLQGEKKKAGAMEILYHYNGKVLECSTSNIFVIKNGVLKTPEKNVLHGITRKTIIELAKENGFKVAEKDIKMSEVWNADEVLITSSGKAMVLPIVKIDDKKISSGKVGPISEYLINAFRELTSNN
ncbi:aminotransferase IV [Candidatus Parcubacteria bacterium]|nr:aminotransferase IV [Candidatus Parcubacteria bacterium]